MPLGQLYTLEPFDNFLPVDYEQQGDQWLEALWAILHRRVPGANGYGVGGQQASSDFHYPHLELNVHGMDGATSVPVDIPALKIVPLTQEDGTKALYVILAARRPITDEDKQLWVECINEAVRRLSEENPEFEWAAALGQTNDPSTQKYSLRAKTILGDVTARSGGRQHVAYSPSSPPSFTGSSFSVSWPVIVEGKSKGYDWMVASRQAGIEVHKVAALLSLAWDSTWYLLQAPHPANSSALKIPKTDAFGRRHHFPHPRKPKSIPKWALVAWAKIDSDTNLSNAVNAYYQGLMLAENHPSFALIAFISSVEIIGKLITGKKCSCCGKDTTDKQAFRIGVREVVSDNRKAKELDLLYESRSSTAHEGKLHANEEALGHIAFPSVFRQDSKAMFVYSDLRKVKAVSRKLLINALRGKINFRD